MSFVFGHNYHYWVLLLIRKLLDQSYILERLKSSLQKVYSRHHDWLTITEYICATDGHGNFQLVIVIDTSFFGHNFHRIWPITGYSTFVTRLWVSSSFSVLCSMEHCFSFCLFSAGHCIVCPSSYSFWQSLWDLQTFLSATFLFRHCTTSCGEEKASDTPVSQQRVRLFLTRSTDKPWRLVVVKRKQATHLSVNA